MHRKSNQVILALLWIHFFLLNDQVKPAHDKMNRSNHYRHLNCKKKKKKSLSTPSFQGRRQLRTHPEWYFPMPLIKVGLWKLNCSICVSNQSDEIHLLHGLNPDSSAHLIGNLIISGVDERKLFEATQRVGLLWDSCAFPLLCKSWASPTG